MKSGTWEIERNSFNKMQRYEIPTYITIAFLLTNSSSKWILLIFNISYVHYFSEVKGLYIKYYATCITKISNSACYALKCNLK